MDGALCNKNVPGISETAVAAESPRNPPLASWSQHSAHAASASQDSNLCRTTSTTHFLKHFLHSCFEQHRTPIEAKTDWLVVITDY